MTREVKLSLIFAFALVLVVGVLLSDHLSGARKASLDGMNPDRGIAMEGPALIPDSSPDLILVNERGERIEPPVKSSPPTIEVREAIHRPWPVLTADGTNPNGPVPVNTAENATLLDRIRERLAQGMQDAVTDLASGDVPPAGVSLTNDTIIRLDPPTSEVEWTSAYAEPADQNTSIVFEERNSSRAPAFTLYEVKPGDTLWSIAAAKLGDGSRHKEILALNKDRMSSAGTLRAGASIRIPSGSASSSKSDQVRKASPTVASSTESKNRKAEPIKKSTKGTYTVKSGDTLSQIAARTLGSSSRYDDLLLANADKLADEHSISPGMVLTIPQR